MQGNDYNISAEDKILDIIKSYSFKDKKYITIDKIDEEVNLGEQMVQQILDSLTNRKILRRKFIFECPNEMCNEIIEVYEMSGIKYRCEECETVFNPLENRSNLLDIVYEYILGNSKKNDGISYTGFFKNQSISQKGVIILDDIRSKTVEKEKYKTEKENKMKKIFISHSDLDKEVVKKFVKLLKDIGVPRDKEHIFCSSYPGLGVEVGQSIPQYIKDELEEDVLVIFMFSENYYQSPHCLCEMGATWVKAHEYLPIIIPPFKFEGIKGFIDTNTLAIDLSSDKGLNELKNKIVKLLCLSEPGDWESDRDDFLDNISRIINK